MSQSVKRSKKNDSQFITKEKQRVSRRVFFKLSGAAVAAVTLNPVVHVLAKAGIQPMMPIQLAQAIDQASKVGQGVRTREIFYSKTIQFNYTSGPIYLSASGTAITPIAIDDAIRLYINGSLAVNQDLYTKDYSSGDLALWFQANTTNEVKIELIDLIGPRQGGSAVWLFPSEALDTIPPTISNVIPRQDGAGKIVISALITDNVKVAAASVWWNNQEFPMQNTDGDRYQVVISTQLNGIKGNFRITAVDPTGNVGYWPGEGLTRQEKIRYTNWAAQKKNTLSLSEPVNTAIGNFYSFHQDLFVPGVGLNFEFKRSYNSICAYEDGPLGVGWSHQYSTHLKQVDDLLLTGIVVTYEDGHTANFSSDGQGYKSPAGDLNRLARNGDQFVLVTPEQVSYRFNADGVLISITETNGNSIRIEHSDGRLKKIVDTVGRGYVFEYDGLHIKTLTDPIGRVYQYVYDSENNLKEFIDPAGGRIKYEYDDEHRLTSMTDPNGHKFIQNKYDDRSRVISQKDASQNESSFEYVNERNVIFRDNLEKTTQHIYDEKLRIVEEKDALGRSKYFFYDGSDNLRATKDREGHETRMEYDERGNLLKAFDALNGVTEFRYNSLNKVTYKRDASGAETTYEYDATGANLVLVTDAVGGQTRMEYHPNGLLRKLTNPKGAVTQFSYDAYGNLKTVTDALNHVTAYQHDQAGRRVKMTDANGHSVQFSYDPNDRVRVITDPKGSTTRFDYDAVGNLKGSIDRRGNPTRYEYNENDSLIKVTDPRGSVSSFGYDKQYHRTSFTNPRSFATQYQYDEVYNLTALIDAKNNATRFEYDADHNLKKVTDAKGGVTVYEYDSLHRLIKTTNALGGVTEYRYDAVGRVIGRSDPNTASTRYEYDRLGRLVKGIDPLGKPTLFGYDAAGNRESVTNARGFTTAYRYNPINQLVEQSDPLKHSTQWEYDGVGNVLTLTDRRGNKTSFAYDANDNLSQITDALGGVAKFTYDPEDNRLTATDQNKHTQTFSYDQAGNLTSVRLPLGQVTRFKYDENGNRTQAINAKQNVTAFTYDPLDLLEVHTSPLGHPTRYQYDALRRVTRLLDAEGNPTGYDYDPLGRMTAVIDALNNTTRYEYDPLGNLKKHIDAKGNATAFDLDLLGRVTKETNPEANTWAYAYDEVGNRIQQTDANSQTTQYEFDGDNRLVRIVYPDSSRVNYEYDPNDNLTGVKDLSGAEAFTYDVLNRLQRTNRIEKILNTKAVTYTYDAVGNRTAVAYPEKGFVMRYEYNENDWLVAAIDPMTAPRKYSYQRDALGLPVRIDYPNATWTTYAYDADARLVNQFNGKPKTSTDIISSFAYTLDKVGNRRRTVEQFTRGQAITWTKDYTYDAIYRLRQVVETPSAKPFQVLSNQYEYDPVGNRLRQTTNIADKPNTPALPAPRITTYTYDRANRLLTADGYTLTGGRTGRKTDQTQVTYGYDKNGNRVKLNGPERAIEYRYDYENRLVGAQTFDVLNKQTKPDSTLDFTYDGLGRRRERGVIDRGVRKTADYLYDGLGYDLLAEYVAPGAPRTTYYYRDPIQVLSRQEIQGRGAGLQYFHHYDGLGNVSAWTNHSGHETQEYSYAPFGRLIDNNGPDNSSNKTDPHNALTFSGKPWDQETELYNFGARDYDPAVGVWLTQDPYRGRLREPMTLHRYGYVRNNPVNLIDRYGYDAIGDVTSYFSEIGEQVKALPEFFATGAYKYVDAKEVIQALPTELVRAADGVANVYELPQNYLHDQSEKTTGITSKILSGLSIFVGAGNPASKVATGIRLASGTLGLMTGQKSIYQFGESVINAGWEFLIPFDPKVRGRLPKFGTEAFFIGKHTQAKAKELVFDMIKDILNDQSRDQILGKLIDDDDFDARNGNRFIKGCWLSDPFTYSILMNYPILGSSNFTNINFRASLINYGIQNNPIYKSLNGGTQLNRLMYDLH
jgi:RHS repeat-associated protein